MQSHQTMQGPERLRTGAFGRAGIAVLFVWLLFPGTALAEGMTWQDAVARLAAERTRAETCASLLKRYAAGDEAALGWGELAYTNAKAEVDGVIAGLIVALAQNDAPSLPSLEAGMTRGFEAREAFCRDVDARLPDDEGTRSAIVEILGGAVGPLIEALKEIYLRHRDDQLLARRTIQTQLEATKWSDFKDIEA